MPPFLTPEQVSLVVAARLLGGSSPDALAVGELLVSLDPESRRLARRYERRIRWLLRHAEPPRLQVQRHLAAAGAVRRS